MKDYRLQKLIAGLLIAIIIDQATKYVSRDIVINTGVSFGLFSGMALSVGLVLILFAIAYKFGRMFLSTSALATGIFFGASLSNIIDRMMYGGVRDFMPVPILQVRNNLADWMIVLALGWLFFRLNSRKTGEKV